MIDSLWVMCTPKIQSFPFIKRLNFWWTHVSKRIDHRVKLSITISEPNPLINSFWDMCSPKIQSFYEREELNFWCAQTEYHFRNDWNTLRKGEKDRNKELSSWMLNWLLTSFLLQLLPYKLHLLSFQIAPILKGQDNWTPEAAILASHKEYYKKGMLLQIWQKTLER